MSIVPFTESPTLLLLRAVLKSGLDLEDVCTVLSRSLRVFLETREEQS